MRVSIGVGDCDCGGPFNRMQQVCASSNKKALTVSKRASTRLPPGGTPFLIRLISSFQP
jgi:hypothetical protein